MTKKRERGEYRPIYEALLDGPQFQQLSPHARLIFFAIKLKTGALGIKNVSGLTHALLEWTGLSPYHVKRGLKELQDFDWVRVERSVVWVVRGLEFEPTMDPSNSKQRTHVQRSCDGLPTLQIVQDFKRYYAAWFDSLPDSPPDSLPDSHDEGHTIAPRSTSTSTSTSTSPNKNPPSARESFFADPRVSAFFEHLTERERTGWRARLGMWLEGEGLKHPIPTPDEIADGLLAAMTVKPNGAIGDNLVRGCIRSAQRGESIRDEAGSFTALLNKEVA